MTRPQTATAPPPNLPTPAGPRQWAGLGVLALPTLLLSADVTVLYLAAPHLAAALDPSGSQLLWITDIYGFMIAGFLVTMGTLGDRIGRRRLLLAGAAAFMAASTLAAYAPTAELLIVARGLLGVAGATLMPSTLALISTMFADPRQRGLAIGIWAACLSGGTAIGPVLGGALLSWFWWGSVFLIGVGVMALLLVTAPFLLPEHRDQGTDRIDLASVGLSLVGMVTTVYGVKRLAEGGGTPYAVAAIVLGIAILAIFVHRQHRLTHPLVDLRLFRHRGFGAALALLLVGLTAVAGTYLFVTLYLQQVSGLSPLAAGLWLVPSALAMVATSVTAPILARRLPVGYVVGGALAVSSLGFGLLALVDDSAGLPLVVAGMVVVYLGQGPLMALSTDLVVGSAPPERAGTASALSETSVELGLALGVAFLGSAGLSTYGHLMGNHPGGTGTDLPVAVAPELLIPAREALTTGLNVVAVIAAALTAVIAVVAVRAFGRHAGTAG